MGQRSKIDWCDATWNPVTGCLHGCKYCYAKRIAERFGGGEIPNTNKDDADEILYCYDDCKCHILDNPASRLGKEIIAPYPFGFSPTFHRYRLDEPQKWKKPKTIFVCSMADLFGEWVPNEWIKEVFEACEKAPWHRYLFLTKNPQRYIELAEKDMLPRQHWYGYTAESEEKLWHFHHADECPCINLFVSIEPIQSRINPAFSTHTPADWVIVGAETGNRKGKIVPKKEWVREIATACEYSGRAIFMKESLREIMGEEFKQELPWEVSE